MSALIDLQTCTLMFLLQEVEKAVDLRRQNVSIMQYVTYVSGTFCTYSRFFIRVLVHSVSRGSFGDKKYV